MTKINKKQGFTLIEILVVIGIIAILAAIVLVAINPARQFRQANNSQRQSNVNAILNAIGQYTVDNKGALPGDITSTTTEISKTGADICNDLVPKYISSLPIDPGTGNSYTSCSSYETGYDVWKDSNGRVHVSAPATEDVENGGPGTDIEVSR